MRKLVLRASSSRFAENLLCLTLPCQATLSSASNTNVFYYKTLLTSIECFPKHVKLNLSAFDTH